MFKNTTLAHPIERSILKSSVLYPDVAFTLYMITWHEIAFSPTMDRICKITNSTKINFEFVIPLSGLMPDFCLLP